MQEVGRAGEAALMHTHAEPRIVESQWNRPDGRRHSCASTSTAADVPGPVVQPLPVRGLHAAPAW